MAGVTGRFPPNANGLREYHSYAMGDYAKWYDAFTAGLAASAPEGAVTLIPVSRGLSAVMLETALADAERRVTQVENDAKSAEGRAMDQLTAAPYPLTREVKTICFVARGFRRVVSK